MKRLWKLLRLAVFAPAILLLGVEGEGTAEAAAAKAAADAAAKKAADEEAAKKVAEEAGKKEVKMTQADLDALIEKRLARGNKAAVEEFLKGLGKNKEEVEALIKSNADDEEKKKTELQKAQEKAAKAEAAVKTATEAANAKLVKALFLPIALQTGIAPACVEDAAVLAGAKLFELKPDDKTGEFSAEEIKEIATELLKAKPWLKGDDKGGNVGGGGGNPGGGNVKPEEFGKQAAEARNKAPENAPGTYDPWGTK